MSLEVAVGRSSCMMPLDLAIWRSVMTLTVLLESGCEAGERIRVHSRQERIVDDK